MAQKSHKPTEHTRMLARTLAGIGVPQPDICLLIGIRGVHTLLRHYRHELNLGMAEANAKVSRTLFEMATVDKNVGAAIFWAKARLGWREKHELDVLTVEEGKKAKAQRESKTAGIGTEWGTDLVSPINRPTLVVNN